MYRRIVFLALIAIALLSGCGSSEEAADGRDVTEPSEYRIELSGDEVTTTTALRFRVFESDGDEEREVTAQRDAQIVVRFDATGAVYSPHPVYDDGWWTKAMIKPGPYYVAVHQASEVTEALFSVVPDSSIDYLELRPSTDSAGVGEEVTFRVLMYSGDNEIDLGTDREYTSSVDSDVPPVATGVFDDERDRVVPNPRYDSGGHWSYTFREPGTYYLLASYRGTDAVAVVSVHE